MSLSAFPFELYNPIAQFATIADVARLMLASRGFNSAVERILYHEVGLKLVRDGSGREIWQNALHGLSSNPKRSTFVIGFRLESH